ncbi:hypothetical protein HBH62_112410 [Parastagonospora nodorum]|nr:hypothetical protein HBH62_112410 [Parastagonospora nodorum]
MSKDIQEAPLRNAADDIVHYLSEVHDHMYHLSMYVKAQEENKAPLYQWERHLGYPALSAAVSKLEKAIAKFRPTRLLPEYLSVRVARATDFSTGVSGAAVDVLAIVNKKTADYMDEMETSTLSEETKAQANSLITEEVQKLMEHSTRAAEQVWHATDMLREGKEGPTLAKDWAWSAAATFMTACIAAAVAVFVAHIYGPSGLALVTGGHNNDMYHQVLDLVERTKAVTNLTGEIHSIKLQEVDQRYNNLAALSESHGLRIDNIVDALGPPNAQGTYYPSTSKPADTVCEARIQKMSQDLSLQLKRQKEDMEMMRKDMHRMDIRLTSGIEKAKKN